MIVVYQLLREYYPCIHIQGFSFVLIDIRLSTSKKRDIECMLVYIKVSTIPVEKGMGVNINTDVLLE